MVIVFAGATNLARGAINYLSEAINGNSWTIGHVRESMPHSSAISPGTPLAGAVFVSTAVIATMIIGSANATVPSAELSAKRGRLRGILHMVVFGFAANVFASVTIGFSNLHASTQSYTLGVAAVRELGAMRQKHGIRRGYDDHASLLWTEPLLLGSDGQPVYFLAV